MYCDFIDGITCFIKCIKNSSLKDKEGWTWALYESISVSSTLFTYLWLFYFVFPNSRERNIFI